MKKILLVSSLVLCAVLLFVFTKNIDTDKQGAAVVGGEVLGVTTDSLLGYWGFNELTSIYAKDLNNTVNLTLSNGAAWSSGKIGAGAVSLDGTNDYVAGGKMANIESISDLSVFIWVKFDTLKSGSAIFNKLPSSSTKQLALILTQTSDFSGLKMFLSNGTLASAVTQNGLFSTDKWYHVGFVFSGGGATNQDRLKIYVDGQSVPLTFTGEIATTTPVIGNMSIGQVAGSGFLDGSVDELYIYNKKLSDTEVLDIFNDTQGLTSGGSTTVGGGSTPPGGDSSVSSSTPPIIDSFTAPSTYINLGESANLSWKLSGGSAESVTIDNGIGSVLNTTSSSVTPSQNTTYTITATNAYGSVNKSLTINVNTIQSANLIQQARPRILNQAWIDSWVNKKNGTPEQQKLWTDLTTYIGRYCSTINSTNLHSLSSCIYPLAVAYAVDNTKTTYADNACQLVSFHLNLYDGDTRGYLDTEAKLKNGNSLRWAGPPFAQAFDIVQDRCTSEQKQVVRENFTYAWNYYNKNSTIYNGKWAVINGPARVSNNIALGQLRAVADMAIAAYDPVEFPQSSAWLQEIIDIYRERVLPCVKNSTANEPYESCYGGSWPEGIEYAPETKTIFVGTLESIRAGTGGKVDLFKESGSAMEDILNYHLVATSPTGDMGQYYKLHEPYPYRDVQHYGYMWTVDRQLMVTLLSYFQRIGDNTRAGYTQWWLKNIQPKHYLNSNSSGGLELFEFMYYDPSVSAISYLDKIRLDLITPFMLLSRSDSTENATWAGFQAMIEGSDHMHGDSGQYQIYRKGEWLTRGIPGYMGNNYVQASVSHNVPILNGHGSFSGASRYGGSMKDGWAKFTRTNSGWKAECNSSYCYAQADMTPQFRFYGYNNTPDVQSVFRDFLHLKPDIFVVNDRYKYVPGLNAMSINPIQTLEPATFSGNRATISNGSQRLYVDVVKPSSPQFQVMKQDSCKVLGAKKIDSSKVDIYVDCWHNKAANSSVTISGATGEWSVINGAWNVSLPTFSITSPYTDGIAYNGERFRITSTSNSFSSIASAWPYSLSGKVTTDIVKDIKINNTPTNLYRLDISSGQYVNEENHFYVMQALDSGVSPLPVVDRSTASVNVGQLGNYVLATPRDPNSLGDISYTFAPNGSTINHYVFGLAPSTSYQVVATSSQITIKQGTGNRSSASGVLNFQTSGISSEVETAVQLPNIYSISTVSIDNSTVSVGWDTDVDTDSQVEYGLTTAYGSSSSLKDSATKTKKHTVSLTGLTPGVKYNFRVKSRDSSGNLAVSVNQSFTTSLVLNGVVIIPSVSVTPPVSTNGSPVSQTANTKTTTTVSSDIRQTITEQTKTTLANSTNTNLKPIYQNLSRGSKHSEVITVQQLLIKESLLSADSATGFYGPITEEAIKAFQRKYNIVSSGTPATTGYGAIGPKTRMKINELLGVPSTGPTSLPQTSGLQSTTKTTIPAKAKLTKPISRGTKGGDVVTLQNVLIKEGLLSADSATGFFGPLTEAALKAFQKKYNIVVSGTPTTTGYGSTGPKTRAKVNELGGY